LQPPRGILHRRAPTFIAVYLPARSIQAGISKKAMTIKVNKRSTRKQLEQALMELQVKTRKNIDLDKYFGKVKFDVGGLEYQKQIRGEWR